MGSNLIGFDIGDSSIKIVQAQGRSIRKAISLELPDNMVSHGIIVSMDAMADFIKEQTKKAGFPKGDACIVLPDEVAISRNVTMAVMSQAQLAYNLPYEFRDYLEQEKSKYFYDYTVKEIIKDEEGNPSEMRLFACAVLKDTISQYRQMLKRAGYKLKVAVPDTYACERFITTSDIYDENHDYCLINIGHNSTKVYFFHQGEVLSERDIEIGMERIEEICARDLGVDIHTAHGYVVNGNEKAVGSQAAIEVYNRLAVEIMKAVNFFNYNNRKASVNDLYIAGGGALIPQLAQTIGEVTELGVKKASEFAKDGKCDVEVPELFQLAFAATL